jgi:hypothetical protein
MKTITYWRVEEAPGGGRRSSWRRAGAGTRNGGARAVAGRLAAMAGLAAALSFLEMLRTNREENAKKKRSARLSPSSAPRSVAPS